MNIEEFLDKFGLSQYEKQAYITLLQIGRCKSKTLSKESKVSYGRIYEILEKLERRGLVQVVPTIPKTFEATEPKTALNLMIRKETDDLLNLKKHIQDIEVPSRRTPKSIEDRTIVLHGKTKQLAMHREIDERARKEIMVIPGVWHPKVASDVTYERALKRGVKVKRLLRKVTKHNRARAKKRLNLGEEIRQGALHGLRLHIADRREVQLSIVDKKTKDRISIYTSNRYFANSMAILFESLWEKSKTIKL